MGHHGHPHCHNDCRDRSLTWTAKPYKPLPRWLVHTLWACCTVQQVSAMPVWKPEHSGVSDTHGSFLRLVAIPLTSYSGQSTAACRAVIKSEFDVIESGTDGYGKNNTARDGWGLTKRGLGKKSGLPCLRLWSPICFAVHSERTRYERGTNSCLPKGLLRNSCICK